MSNQSGTMARSVHRSTLPADAAVLGIAVVWGASYPVTKSALAYAPVLVLIFYRFLVTASVMSLAARRELASAPRGDILRGALLGVILAAIFISEIAGIARTSATNAALWGRVAFLSLLCTVAAFYVQNAAVRRTSPTRVGFLMGTEPLFGFALAHILLSEPITSRAAFGAVLIVAGTFAGLLVDRQPG